LCTLPPFPGRQVMRSWANVDPLPSHPLLPLTPLFPFFHKIVQERAGFSEDLTSALIWIWSLWFWPQTDVESISGTYLHQYCVYLCQYCVNLCQYCVYLSVLCLPSSVLCLPSSVLCSPSSVLCLPSTRQHTAPISQSQIPPPSPPQPPSSPPANKVEVNEEQQGNRGGWCCL
jgi:hypothetical protein